MPDIKKSIINKPFGIARQANLCDYGSVYKNHSWQAVPHQQLNICYQAIERHLHTPVENKIALRWIAKDESVTDFTYTELANQTSRFASALEQLGLKAGVRVFSLAGRLPQLYIAALGTLKFGGVFTPLFSAFGPEPIRSRMEIGEANVLITTKSLYRKKVAVWSRELSHLSAIIFIDSPSTSNNSAVRPEMLDKGCYWLSELLTQGDESYPCAKTHADDMALLHFTSGTTGKPKGVVHVHQAVIAHETSAKYALNLKQDDIYWCTADPGWVTGTSYGIIAPLCLGVTMIVDEAEFEVERWYRILQQQKVSVWYTSPTAIRMLMRAGADIRAKYDLSTLTFIASVGEPLNAEAVRWSEKVLGLPFHDNWWQTETGSIMIANLASQTIKLGSMGLPLPGVEASIVQRNDKGVAVPEKKNMTVGELAIKQGWPSMFRGYLHQQEKYQQCFSNGWYLTGDLAMKDEQGYYWFVGRADDLIKSSGHLIGPFEVESALMEHEAVAEVGVIGIPDELAGELVKAFVALKPNVDMSDSNLLVLNKALKGFARKKLGAAVSPKEIVFRQNLPKTRSGKIMRRLLKARELNLPEGDISTLESDER